MRSMMTTSGLSSFALRTASSPFAASPTTAMSFSNPRMAFMPARTPHGLATPPYGIVTDFAGLKPHTGGMMCIANFYMRVQHTKITLKKGVPVTISFVARAAAQ